MTTGGFELPEFDELTHRWLLPKSALRHGAYYIGRCRNACVAIVAFSTAGLEPLADSGTTKPALSAPRGDAQCRFW